MQHMHINIYNSLTRKKEILRPLQPPQINMYTCGVTVYDECHIGHARSLYTFDFIRRYLEYHGFKVTFVRNITDIDDKIINRSNELKVEWKTLVEKYIRSYYQDMKSLNIKEADIEPRATENIPDMITHIQGLIDENYAYEAGGDVYFNVRKFHDYGKLSGQSIEQMRSGARIELTELKNDPLDFALWKSSKEGEPSWESPWGRGRPGWHIECSVMSMKYLKTQILDIHAGGRDLIFPHHENEIAQAEALTRKPFAKYWIHHGLLTINGQKMSKSLGNFVTVKDFMKKYKDADILKLFFLTAHYSHPINFTDKKIEEARQSLERIIILKDKINKILKAKGAGLIKKPTDLDFLRIKFMESMDDDFNAPQALAVIFDLVNLANKHIDDPDYLYSARVLLSEFAGVFGLDLDKEKSLSQEGLDEKVSVYIEERNKARKDKDFKKADEIRKRLEDEGIILEDNKDGTTSWRKKI